METNRPAAPARLTALLATIVLFSIAGEPPTPTPVARATVTDGTNKVVSLNPSVNTFNASSSQLVRLAEALDRFSTAGLALPDLEVRFSSDQADCNGHKGRFTATTEPWQISICSDMGSVYEHELAHAWEHANLSDRQRSEFMRLRGYAVWADRKVPWNERGMEGVAFIIQQGLSGLPLPPALSHEHCSRLAAFQLLTGMPDPRLDEWAASGHDVSSCAESVQLRGESATAVP